MGEDEHHYEAHVMPTCRDDKGEEQIDIERLVMLLRSLGRDTAHCYLELNHAFPKQGVKSTWTHAMGYGALRGILTCEEIPHSLIHPKVWHREMFHEGVPSERKARKALAIEKCEFMFPLAPLVPFGCKEPSDGMADALMLAECCKRAHLN